MATITELANLAFQDFVQVNKGRVREAFGEVESRVEAITTAQASGLVIFDTVATANGVGGLAFPAQTGALITNDPAGDVTNGNGYYQKLGAPGAGSWQWLRLPPWDQRRLRIVTALGAATVSATELGVAINKASNQATTVNIPSAVTRNSSGAGPVVVKDKKGNAGTWGITVVPAAGTIDGFANILLERDFVFVELAPLPDGSGYVVTSIGPA